MFQRLNCPSAPSVRPSRPRPAVNGHVITMESATPASTTRRHSRRRAMVPGGASMYNPVILPANFFAAVLAAMVAAAALWVSFGTVGGDGTGARIALLPFDAPHLAAAAIAGACVLAIGARRARGWRVAAAVPPLLLLLAPW